MTTSGAGTRPRGRQQPTQADVARVAGVSQTTVSLVLTGQGVAARRVSEAVRQRVLRAIDVTGYSVNLAAQSLVGGRTSIVGVYTFESVFPTEAADFYHPFLAGLEAEAESLGIDLLLFTSLTRRGRPGIQRLRTADGCVLLGRHSSETDLAELVRQGLPFSFIGRREAQGHAVPYAGADYAAGTAEVVDHLLDLGHRRIAFVSAYTGHVSAADRLLGYRQATARAGTNAVVFDGAETNAGDVIDEVRAAGMTAIVAASDMADSLRRAADERGLRIPEDMSIARLGDPESVVDADIDWTGFVIPRVEMGAEALRIVLRQLSDAGDEPIQVLIPCEFARGSTTGPPTAGPQQ